MKEFHMQKGAGPRKLQQAKKVGHYLKVTFFQWVAGVCQTGYLTSADLVKSRLTGLRIHFWEREPELQRSLSLMWSLAQATPLCEQCQPMGLTQGAYAGPFSQVFPECAWHPASAFRAHSHIEADPLAVLESSPSCSLCSHRALLQSNCSFLRTFQVE